MIDVSLKADLIDRARHGDTRALERLLAICQPDLRRYARQHCESEDVDEAVQDALWILYRRLGALRSVAALAGWLFQVVRHICLRIGVRRRPDVPLDALPEARAVDLAATDAELRATLSHMIGALPPIYREVILLQDVMGHSAEEAANLLHISVEGCKSRLHRARALLREVLADQRVVPAKPRASVA